MRLCPDRARRAPVLAALALLLAAGVAGAKTVDFAGYTWDVRAGGGGPGPNQWSADNVSVAADGLHLRIAVSAGQWSCAEVTMTRALGFGTYEFELAGRPDLFDRNVVLGLFDYPTPDIGPDGTNEIDIEFAQWGDAGNDRRLNWTVYPPALGPAPTHRERPLSLSGNASTHRFDWTHDGVRYASFDGWQDAGGRTLLAKWNDAPAKPGHRIPQQPLPVHMNLWLFDGHAPADGREVEVVIRSFSFTPH
jgi:hypothetical protein